MGAANSSLSPLLFSLVLAAGLLFVIWKQGKIIREISSLRSLVESSVSLHELEEQVMPAIDSLEQGATKLNREMQQLARRVTRGSEEVISADVNEEAPQPNFCRMMQQSEQASELRAGLAESLQDLQLLMGLQNLVAPEMGGPVGIPTTHVVIGTNLGPQEPDPFEDVPIEVIETQEVLPQEDIAVEVE